MVIGGLATIPARVNTLESVVASIVPQVDLLYVVLNGHTVVPSWLREISNVKYVVANNSRGDAMKFAFCEKHQDVYYLSFDDDLLYPVGYVRRMLDGVKKYNGVVSLHGKTYPRPPEKFYKPLISYHCFNFRPDDTDVDIIGTGVCAFHTSRLKVKLADFLEPNMADIWLSKLAWEQGVPLKVLSHPSRYLTYLQQENKNTIWHQQAKTKFEKQTELLQTFLR